MLPRVCRRCDCWHCCHCYCHKRQWDAALQVPASSGRASSPGPSADARAASVSPGGGCAVPAVPWEHTGRVRVGPHGRSGLQRVVPDPCACLRLHTWPRAHLPTQRSGGEEDSPPEPVPSAAPATMVPVRMPLERTHPPVCTPWKSLRCPSAPTPQSRALYPLVRGRRAQPRRRQGQAAGQGAGPLGAECRLPGAEAATPTLQPGALTLREDKDLLQLIPEEQMSGPGWVPLLWALIKAVPLPLHRMTNHPL